MNTTPNQTAAGDDSYYAVPYNDLVAMSRKCYLTPAHQQAIRQELSLRRITGSSAEEARNEMQHLARSAFYSDTDRLALLQRALRREQSKKVARKSVVQRLVSQITTLTNKKEVA